MKTILHRLLLLGALTLAACGSTETGSSSTSTTGPGPKKGVSKGAPGTSGSGGAAEDGVDPDLSDPSIVGSTRPPLGGSQAALKCVVTADTSCTTDTWTNYA
ncbi:MAG TPA: hypothetical protein VFH51_16090, partial [Myxococcota bacterium]|nr:hypothetical protein [Myxococcota bacterium]